jgi:hypothetical protein
MPANWLLATVDTSGQVRGTFDDASVSEVGGLGVVGQSAQVPLLSPVASAWRVGDGGWESIVSRSVKKVSYCGAVTGTSGMGEVVRRVGRRGASLQGGSYSIPLPGGI